MSTLDLITLPMTLLAPYREARRIKDLEQVLRFDKAEVVIHRNNLHTHMQRVGFLSYDLANHLRTNYNLAVNPEEAKRLAFYHDDPEVITGDIPTPIKYSMKPDERMELRKAEEEAIRALATRYFGLNPLSRRRKQYLADQETMTKKESTEARIVNIADKMEGLCETIHEIRCGNQSFSQILKNYRNFFENFIPNEPLFELVNGDAAFRITLKTIPTIEQANHLQKIHIETFTSDPEKFWEEVFAKDLPGFYKKWLITSAKHFEASFLFSGWGNVLKESKPPVALLD